jgi:hypothetical protein
MLSALLIHGVPIECINRAAIHNYVPAKIIISVLETEGGRVGMASPNSNGTYDFGPMQINTIWLKKIAPYGYTQQDIQFDPCKNVMVGTWILSQQIAENAGNGESTYWKGIGDYHSHTLDKNIQYQQIVYRHYASLERLIGYA